MNIFIYSTYLDLEDGTPVISVSNAIKNVGYHGSIVGAIHRINADGTNSTILFYWDGFTHECLGTEIGSKSEKVKCLKGILQMIPFVGMMIEGDVVVKVGSDSDTNNSTVNYIFRPPFSEIPSLEFLQNSLGNIALDNYIEVISTDENSEIVELW